MLMPTGGQLGRNVNFFSFLHSTWWEQEEFRADSAVFSSKDVQGVLVAYISNNMRTICFALNMLLS